LNVGDICEVDFSEDCGEANVCTGDEDNGFFCIARPLVGEACDDDICFESLCNENICTAYPQLGDECNRFDDFCQGDTYCEGSFNDGYFCTAYPREGDPCDRFNDFCQGDTSCEGNFTDGYFCAAFPRVGEECNRFDDLCIDSVCGELPAGDYVCLVPPALGEACNPGDDRCTEGQCHGVEGAEGLCISAPAANGDPCDISYGCFEGAFCEATDGDLGLCVASVCGDNIVNGTESCDDGNTDNDDGCSAECSVEPIDSATVDANVIDLTFEGELDQDDYEWNRVQEDCVGTFRVSYYELFEVTNSSDVDVQVDVTASWTFDGHLHVYSSPAVSNTDYCIDGDDDFGGFDQSQVAGVTIAAGTSIYIVASSYGAAVTGTYSISVTGGE
jgi:cysteine-rich repeat protein